MQAQRLPAERGAWWLLQGFRLFRRNPPLLTALTVIYLLLVQTLATVLPGLGPILLPLILPALTLVVANGCRLVDEGSEVGKASLLAGLVGNGAAMLRLGILQLTGAMLLVILNMAMSDGSDPLASLDPSLVQNSPQVGGNEAAGPAQEAAALVALLRLMVLSMPLILAFWFAPFLTGWDRVSPLKALFFSTVATWRNWRAMSMFSLAAILLAGIVPGVILIGASQVTGMALSVAFVALRMVLVFFIAPVLTASIYISYRDIFRPSIDENV